MGSDRVRGGSGAEESHNMVSLHANNYNNKLYCVELESDRTAHNTELSARPMSSDGNISSPNYHHERHCCFLFTSAVLLCLQSKF